jgi:hypothetical protein
MTWVSYLRRTNIPVLSYVSELDGKHDIEEFVTMHRNRIYPSSQFL